MLTKKDNAILLNLLEYMKKKSGKLFKKTFQI